MKYDKIVKIRHGLTLILRHRIKW